VGGAAGYCTVIEEDCKECGEWRRLTIRNLSSFADWTGRGQVREKIYDQSSVTTRFKQLSNNYCWTAGEGIYN
jgi:hypothetical protein